LSCECGYSDGLVKDEKDGVTYCPLCGLIPEPSPGWSLTHEDMTSIYTPKDPEKDIPAHNDPRMNKKGYQMYKEHTYELLKRLGVE
jgi:uncharacterized Zn finger protein (UPF0148 family)